VALFEQTPKQQYYFSIYSQQQLESIRCLLAARLVLAVGFFLFTRLIEYIGANGADTLYDFKAVAVAEVYLVFRSWMLADLNQKIKNKQGGSQQVVPNFLLSAQLFTFLKLYIFIELIVFFLLFVFLLLFVLVLLRIHIACGYVCQIQQDINSYFHEIDRRVFFDASLVTLTKHILFHLLVVVFA